jgi:ankyrin repeat protein
MNAILYRNDGAIGLLLGHGADVNACDEYGATALMMAALVMQANSMKTLLAHHADVSIRNRHGDTALLTARRGLMSATKHGGNIAEATAIVQLLEAAGAVE